MRRVYIGSRCVGTVESESGRGWNATSVYGGRALCPSQARARTWVVMEAEKHMMVPVAALAASGVREVHCWRVGETVQHAGYTYVVDKVWPFGTYDVHDAAGRQFRITGLARYAAAKKSEEVRNA